MPYIKQENKTKFAMSLMHLYETMCNHNITPGELNYLLTELSKAYIITKGEMNYALANEVIGALEGAKLEFYRRMVAPYEDMKIKENGDVY